MIDLSPSRRVGALSEREQRTLAERVLARYRPLIDSGAESWSAFIDALLRPLRVCVWAHPGRCDPRQLLDLIGADDIDASRAAAPVSWNPTALRLAAGLKVGQRWWYCAGLAHAQEEASQLPVRLMDLRPGQRVLDLCAAPGGKTAQIALALGNRGTLLANDFARERMSALQGNLDRLGIVNCSTTWHDGGNFSAAAGPFDRVLVDAPCSSEGTLRRHRSLAERLDPVAIASNQRLQGRQLALLRKAIALCRAGGRVVYSTCTFAPEENECIIARLLDEQAGRVRLLPVQVAQLNTAAGVTHWAGQELDPSLARCLRLWPHQTDTGGFFVAVLEKAADAPELPSAASADLSAAAADQQWLPDLAEHYGWSRDLWPDFRTRRQTRRGLHLLAADHCPPREPAAQGRGLFFLRTNIHPPKLTTAGALLFGRLATRQVIELDACQRDAYLRRDSLTPTRAQWAECRPGQVIVRYLGHSLGVALLTRSGTLESLFPSRWSGCAGGAASNR